MPGVLDLLAAIAITAVATCVLFLAHGRHGDDRGGPRAELVRYVGLAGFTALICAAMNVLELLGGGTVAAAVGNATNVFAPALVWAGARRLNARPAIGVVSAGAGGILMLAATFLMPLDDATLIKTAGLVVFSALAAAEIQRRPLSAVAGAGQLTATLAAFGIYNIARLIVAAATGMHSWLWQSVASQQVTTVVSAIVILSMGIASVRMGRQLDDDPMPGTRAHARRALRDEARALLKAHGTLDAVVVRIPELDLIRAAHRAEGAHAVLSALVDAARSVVSPGCAEVPARDTVIALLAGSSSPDETDEAVRRAFAAGMPGIGYDDTPDITLEHRRITDPADLSVLMEARRLRPWSGDSERTRRPR